MKTHRDYLCSAKRNDWYNGWHGEYVSYEVLYVCFAYYLVIVFHWMLVIVFEQLLVGIIED